MPFVAPLRRDRQTPRSRSRSHTPANSTPVIPSEGQMLGQTSGNSANEETMGQRPSLSSGNMNGPQRNISTSSNASGATSTSASSTSSLEAVPIRPAAGTRVEGYEIGAVSGGGGVGLAAATDSPPRDSISGSWTDGTPIIRNPNNGGSSSGFIVLSRNPSNQSTSTQSSPYHIGMNRGRDDTMVPGAPAATMTMRNTVRGDRAGISSGVWTSSPSASATNLVPPTEHLSRSRTPPSPSPVAYTDQAEFPLRGSDQAMQTHQPNPRRSPNATSEQSPNQTSSPPQPPSPFQAQFPLSASSATISSTPYPRPMSAMQQLFLPAEMRSSSSGPDLAVLQRDRERERRERARQSEEERQGDEADGEADDDPHDTGFGGTGTGTRTKVRTRSSGASTVMDKSVNGSPAGQTMLEAQAAAGQGALQARAEPRKIVTLEDFTFGSTLGRGSYSVVVLASQNTTQIPYAVKILDQQQLMQEKKTKYAKIERDALIRLGPRASASSNGSCADGKQREGDRRGSIASQGSSHGALRPRRELTEPGKRRRPSSTVASQNGVMLEKDGGVPTVMERHSTEMRRENFTDHGKAQARDVGLGGDHRRPIMSMSGGGDPIMQTGRPVGRPESQMPESWSNPTLSGTSHTTGASRRTLLLQTANLPSLRSDESALALSPDSVKSATTFLGNPREQSQPKFGRAAAPRRRVAHPGVVKLHYTFKDNASLYFVLDLAINGELLGLIRKHGSLDIQSARVYAAQIIDTIDFMHERGVIHRDLKPENILLDDDMRVKITDFGSAKIVDPETMLPLEGLEDGKKRSFVGTAEYVSPEVLQNDPATTASDIWAFACIVFQMLAGRPPFRGATEYLTFQKVLKAEYEFPEGFDAQAKDLIESIFKIEASARLSVESIKSHPFFTAAKSSSIETACIKFNSIWTDVMPPLSSGLVPAPPPATSPADLSRHGWRDFLGHSGTSGSEDTHGDADEDDGLDSAEEEEIMRRPGGPPYRQDSEGARHGPEGTQIAQGSMGSTGEPHEQDKALQAPRRRWLKSQGGAIAGASSNATNRGGTPDSGNGTDDDVSLIGAGVGSGRESTWGIARESLGGRRPSESGSRGAATIRLATQETIKSHSSVWNGILLPSERILYSSPILYRSPASLFLPKRRTLILTSLPRLICAKEDSSTPDIPPAGAESVKIGTGIRVKAECLFGRAALDLLNGSQFTGGQTSKESKEKEKPDQLQVERIRRTVAKVWEKGPRAFVVQTPEKDHTFLAESEDIRTRWMSEIAQATKGTVGSHVVAN